MSGNDSFKKESQWLLKEKYHLKKSLLYYIDLLRLRSGTPLAYVIENISFLGCTIDLHFKPLIPRTETEFWTERAISEIKKRGNFSPHILDIFAGSGCIGVALLYHLPNASVVFGEKSEVLIWQINKNLKLNRVEKRGCAIQSDCFNSILKIEYDYIFANPPYIPLSKKNEIQKSVLEHEPHEALFAEDDGLFYIKKLLNESNEFLKRNGLLFIEFNTDQKETIETLIPKDIYDYEFWKDQFDKWRVVVLTKR
jgi:release factor glutamine methyltransferase